MQLITLGINHQTAPIAIREKLAFNSTQLFHGLQNLLKNPAINEAVILSTCNRTEIYSNTNDPAAILEWLTKEKSLHDMDLKQYTYTYAECDAVRHIMRVANGLDSMVLGESQVLGQMKQAYQLAENAGAIRNTFMQLFPTIFATSKRIRTATNIGAHPISIAYTITQLIKKHFEKIEDVRVLFIGAGETIELAATHLHGLNIKKIRIANRTIEKSQYIAQAIQAEAIRMQDIPDYLKETDIVITATASQLPLLGKGLIENTLRHNGNAPLLLIDLAVPRDIEPEVATLPHTFLYNMDDLQEIISHHLKNRSEAAKEAETMIELAANEFYRDLRVYHARHVITEYRQRLDDIRLAEQAKAFQQLQNNHDPVQVLEQFGHNLIQKILHHPTMKLREAASEERCEMFQRIKTFFEL
jgi:glutamyl-tRNA reductase